MLLIKLLLLCLFIILFSLVLKKTKRNNHIYKIRQSKKILKKINTFKYPGEKINYLKKINPFVFEELLLSAFENKGYKIKRNKKYTGDNGIDGIIFDVNKDKILIQAKRYSNYIKKKHVSEFIDKVNSENANKGFFIHTGKSSKEIRNAYNNSKITIIGGKKLLELINY